MVAGALELRSGLVLMVDAAEMDLVVVDFAKGTRAILGRKGSGPGEYRAPGAILQVPGDTIWIFDAMQQRIASSGAATQTVLVLHTVYLLAAGDYLSLNVRQTSGGNLDASATGHSPRLWVVRRFFV